MLCADPDQDEIIGSASLVVVSLLLLPWGCAVALLLV